MQDIEQHSWASPARYQCYLHAPPHARMSLDIAKGPPEGEGQNHPGLRILDCSLQGRDDPKT